ncbi:NADH-quinone oxidoreductase subunit NuoH [Phenylobacterium montanum]|uniref:NADH-quinone oxidoreductase subunit H n=1 Tax=Phenylobacterium montanum TaxID=2823693 RepID=A0A975IV07_9CAUL|nr:NADH-quinone oxidoreductase subunit NuoH [Caulobacter sp. S6]QUD88502.1 NADH-quinone oxidoreductase subunit NuoH [Caulobacter sp. S6]
MIHEGLPAWAWFGLTLAQILIVTVVLLLCVAYVIYAERKIFAGAQMRKGPNVVGPIGLFQSFADLGKFILKELVIPDGADKFVFILAPILSTVLAFAAWSAIPFAPGWVISNINVGILYLFAISSLGVYGVMFAGWASNSKYPFLGALRSAAQMVSYEVSIGFVIITVVILTGSMKLQDIVAHQAGGFWHWNMFGGGGVAGLPLTLVMIPMMVIFFISALAETNRPPFDLPEAESELVAGYQIEYSSGLYLMIYLAEMCNIILMSALLATFFMGGWQSPIDLGTEHWNPWLASFFGLFCFLVKTIFWLFMFIMVRVIVPRYRYDQLMRLGWKVLLPTTGVAVVLVSAWRVFGPGHGG